MKFFPMLEFVTLFMNHPQRRRNLMVLGRMLLLFALIVALFSGLFHYFMGLEGREYSWPTSVYWTLVVMSTLGFGDITFTSTAGQLFSVVVLLSGTVYLLMLLPFVFIQFAYLPWVEAASAARAPRKLPDTLHGHVILTNFGPLELGLIRLLNSAQIPYVIIVSELQEALRLHDEGYKVMLGDSDAQETYLCARVLQAALVVTTRSDPANTNIAFTVRENAPDVTIVATANSEDSVDILELAGCNRVLQMGYILGQALARRVLGRNGKSHVIAEFGELRIAEVAVHHSELVGQTLRSLRLPELLNISVVGAWERGRFHLMDPEKPIRENTILILAGSEAQLAAYDQRFGDENITENHVVIIGGGRVGRSMAFSLEQQGIQYRIVEKDLTRVPDSENYVIGDAAALHVLHRAGIQEASCVVITTHDDDINVYLTIYCRRLRPDIHILARANQEKNISTLHRAGADFILSYATMAAGIIFNLLKRANVVMLSEGLDAFRIPVPEVLVGKSLIESRLRQTTGCNVVAIVTDEKYVINPNPHQALRATDALILMGDIDAEQRFLNYF